MILDFGSQYTQLISRRVREMNVLYKVYPFNNFPPPDSSVRGVILSGSPWSVYEEGAPAPDLSSIKGRLPLLGVCYGAQYLSHNHGGEVLPGITREYGRASLIDVDTSDPLFEGVTPGSRVWMSHADTMVKVPDNYRIIGSTEEVRVAAFRIAGEETWGVQFHLEAHHTEEGERMLRNFVIEICGSRADATTESFVDETILLLREQLGGDRVIMALSGGLDSTVTALLLQKAIGDRVTNLVVNSGLLRKNEFEEVVENYNKMGLRVKGVDASSLFLQELNGVADPEIKRKRVGRIFIELFEKEASAMENTKWLAQGTVFNDVIESLSLNGLSVTIKSHHNVGGLPERMQLKLVEPLRHLFKDEVREIGKAMGIPAEITGRHSFPGSGLAVRIVGEVTEARLEMLREPDEIFTAMLRKSGLYARVWRAAVILLTVQTVGTKGDQRSYENVAVLRAVSSVDGMTADWYHLPHEFLAEVSSQITNRVRGINRVVYDISSKPPSTIEWE